MLHNKINLIGMIWLLAMLTMTSHLIAVELTPDEQKLLDKSIPEYLSIIYPPEIPRAFAVHRTGCPVCGEAIKKHGTYPWIITPEKPFKVQCPECKSIFPDNDFEAYWKSGFKDKSLLTGKYVDEGRGWRPAPNEPKYWFVAYYTHWIMHKDTSHIKLSDAYSRTGNPGFARRTLAILDKFAERYKDYNYSKQSRYAEEVQSNYDGRILNSIWECFMARHFAQSYYKVKDFLNTNDSELEQALGKTCAQIKQNIENNMFRVMANDIMTENGKIRGNFGMHQIALLEIAKCLDAPEMIKWVTDFRKNKSAGSIPLNYALFSNIFGDGAPIESPGYNVGWLNNICDIIKSLKENGVDIFATYPKAKRLYTYPAKLMVCGKFCPASGDAGNMTNSAIFFPPSQILRFVYASIPDPRIASMINVMDKRHPLPENLTAKNFGYESNMLSAYGLASLQNGNRKAPTAVVLAFPNYIGHRHGDSLNLDFFAENVPLIPDFGYPDTASMDDPTRLPYLSNTLVHNTVVVNAMRQKRHPGTLLEYDRGQVFQRMVADCNGVYEATSKYKRAVTTIEVAPGKTIVFDVFRVKGGHQHDWFMHSCGETFSWAQKLEKQKSGTLAGENVPFGMFYDSAAYKNKTVRSYASYYGSGYQFLTDVQRGNALPGTPIILPPTPDKRFQARKGATFKIYPLDQDDAIYISHGRPPITRRYTQKHVVFITRRRISADENLESMFSSILESSSHAIAKYDIEKVEPLSKEPLVAVAKITFKDGKRLYLFDAENELDFTCDDIDFHGYSGAVLIADTINAFVSGPGSIKYKGKTLASSNPDFKAKVVNVDIFAENITMDREVPQDFVGQMFRVGNYAYIADHIEGKTIAIRDQSTIRGRFRLLKYKNNSSKEGIPRPGISLANPGMSLYDNNGKYVSKLDIQEEAVKAEKELELNKDYWVSECGNGDEAIFPHSTRILNILY